MPIFSSYIVWYLFLAGLGSGCFFIAASCGLYDTVKKTTASQALLKQMQSGFFVAPCCAILAAIFLCIDLGAPERVWFVLLTPFNSIVSIGAWLVMLFIAVSGVLAVCGLVLKTIPRSILLLCWIIGAILSMGVMLYTGLLLSDMAAIDFWHTWLLPVLFVASSLSSGLAAMLGIGAFSQTKEKKARSADRLSLFLSVLEVAVLIAFLVDRFLFSEAARDSCELLLWGEYAILFWIGVCLSGFIVPFLIQVFYRVVKIPALKIVATAGVLIGSLCLRYCIVGVAAYTPVMVALS